MAHMGKLESTVLVIPNSEFIVEGLQEETVYLEVEIVGEVTEVIG